MATRNMSISEVKRIDMVEYLERLGYKPAKIRNNDYWYLSPLRDEKTPSFKINRIKNVWYDHAIGKGGTLVDFGKLYYQCTVKDLLSKLENEKGIIVSFAAGKYPGYTNQSIRGNDSSGVRLNYSICLYGYNPCPAGDAGATHSYPYSRFST